MALLEFTQDFLHHRSNYSSVAAGDSHTCAIKTNGTLECWGSNAVGQLGDGTLGPSSRPVVLGSAYSLVTAGRSHTCAVSGEKFKCWGSNSSGQFGDGSTLNQMSVPTDRNAGSCIIDSITGELFNVACSCSTTYGCRIQFQTGAYLSGIDEIHYTITDGLGLYSDQGVATFELYHIEACMDPSADNYNSAADIDDGSCQIGGCMNSNADNYNSSATYDNGTCQLGGCMIPEDPNYDPAATYDNGTCAN